MCVQGHGVVVHYKPRHEATIARVVWRMISRQRVRTVAAVSQWRSSKAAWYGLRLKGGSVRVGTQRLHPTAGARGGGHCANRRGSESLQFTAHRLVGTCKTVCALRVHEHPRPRASRARRRRYRVNDDWERPCPAIQPRVHHVTRGTAFVCILDVVQGLPASRPSRPTRFTAPAMLRAFAMALDT